MGVVYGAVARGDNRWLRLRPADPVDLLLVFVMGVGVVLYLWALVAEPPGVGWDWAQPVVQGFFVVHGSSPVFLFTGALGYLLRWGRCIGRDKAWLVAGVVLTVPLWFLGGLPLAVRGVGDVTVFMVPWNLAAFGVMMVGVYRSLHGSPRGKERAQRSRG